VTPPKNLEKVPRLNLESYSSRTLATPPCVTESISNLGQLRQRPLLKAWHPFRMRLTPVAVHSFIGIHAVVSLQRGGLDVGRVRGKCGVGRPCCSTGHTMRHHIAAHPAPRRHPGSLGYGSVQRASRPPRYTRTERPCYQHGHAFGILTAAMMDGALYLLLTDRTASGCSGVSWMSSVSWRITRPSPSRSAYATVSRPISTSSICPR
jgi:hypothetical protein